MRPQRSFENHKTEASVLLFAHNTTRAGQILSDIQSQDQGQNMIRAASCEFADILIKDWTSGIVTEQQIALEFLDPRERKSIRSSAQAEQVILSVAN